MDQHYSTAAIILAAGSSSRMGGGRHKLLLPLHNRPVLAHVIEAALASQARPVIIVLGHQAEQVRGQIFPDKMSPDIMLVENPNYLQGMSTSMHLGIQALTSNGYKKNKISDTVDSALILLGDQPLLTARVIDSLITMYRKTGKRIVAPMYDGKRGSPVLFDKSFFPELLEITGDEGGRKVVERHREDVEAVEMSDAMANYDVDTWEAYQQILEAWERKKME
ncbi:MAG TPA: nucleotidyltransferase family protein [Ktedonobacteraceae bacterium]|nr:nucleotidyltransferase family protein [Ktedonobacteraceae bacterium]